MRKVLLTAKDLSPKKEIPDTLEPSSVSMHARVQSTEKKAGSSRATPPAITEDDVDEDLMPTSLPRQNDDVVE